MFTVILAMAVAGCGSSSSITTSPSPAKCAVAVSGGSAVDSAGGTRAVTVTTQPECAWTAASQASWITELAPVSGQGNGEIRFRVGANPAATPRAGELVVNDTHTRIEQAAAPAPTIAGPTPTPTPAPSPSPTCVFAIAPVSYAAPSGGGRGPAVTITTGAGCAWTASSNAGWITIVGGASGSGTGTVTYAVAPVSGAARTGSVTIAGRTLSISQAPAAASCSYSISATGRSFERKKDEGSVRVTAGAACNWSASVTRGDSWISITSGASATGNGTVTYRVDNNNGDRRTGTLLIAGHTFTVTQEAKD